MADGSTPAWRRALFSPREGRLRAGWRLVVVIPALVAALALASVPTVAVTNLTPDTGPVAAVGFAVTWLVLYAFMATAVLALARWVDKRPWNAWFRDSLRWWDTLIGLCVGVGMVTVAVLAGLAAGAYRIAGTLVSRPDAPVLAVPDAAVDTGTTDPLLVIALLFAVSVGVGVFEELLVRGYLLTNLAEGIAGMGRLGSRGALAVGVLATSLLFGVLHLGNPGAAGQVATVNIVLAGLFFAWTYLATGSLGIPIGIHIGWNFGLGGVYGLPISGLESGASLVGIAVTGDTLLTGAGFGPEASLLFYPALVAGVLASAAWIRRSRGALAIRDGIARYHPPAARTDDDG